MTLLNRVILCYLLSFVVDRFLRFLNGPASIGELLTEIFFGFVGGVILVFAGTLLTAASGEIRHAFSEKGGDWSPLDLFMHGFMVVVSLIFIVLTLFLQWIAFG